MTGEEEIEDTMEGEDNIRQLALQLQCSNRQLFAIFRSKSMTGEEEIEDSIEGEATRQLCSYNVQNTVEPQYNGTHYNKHLS